MRSRSVKPLQKPNTSDCLCGSGKSAESCCHAYHAGATAPTAEALMRSRYVACVHCVEGSGCTIYAERPESCRVYECLWLRSQKFEKPLGPQLRPDRCHVVIGTINNGNEAILYVDPAHRNAWKEPGFSEALGLFCTRGIPVHVSCNDVVERVY